MAVHGAVFGTGSFRRAEASFRTLPGVIDTTVGYMGGAWPNPTYPQVCTGRTGHVEVVRVLYDDRVLPYTKLLDHFWAMHDPTARDRQGNDVGPQYRSIIFVRDAEQERAAHASLERLERRRAFGGRPIVTEIQAAAPFWQAESYHQRYYEKRGSEGRAGGAGE
jgi:peptide-methionine (S)-S-oxide reductase